MISPLAKATIQSIVNIYETGSVRGDYANVTLIAGDTGGLTYGRSQTTRASGNLYKLIEAYCGAPGAKFASGLSPYVDRLQKRDPSLDRDWSLKELLRRAGQDPVMRMVQDAFFDEVYWQPAVAAAERAGIITPLGMATVYDGTVHGSWARMAQRTTDLYQSVRAAGEKNWVRGYVRTRRKWLLSCAMPLPNTVYRMDSFQTMIDRGNWDLSLPLVAHGVTITLASMGIEPDGWTLYLGDKKLGATWQNPSDEYRNYFPARALLNALHGEKETAGSLQFTNNILEWKGSELHVPALFHGDGSVWGQVRALAGSQGLAVERDEKTRTLRLVRLDGGAK